jgi:hypothetical protein
MPYAEDVQNAMLELLGSGGAKEATHLSLHTADPGDTGADELAGGSYARQAITWEAAAGGLKVITGTPLFQIPAGVTITHFGLWSASSAGSWRGGGALPAEETYGAPGTYEANSLTIDV